jgi:glycosyltransferase involved in cell wall biosynthesis
MTVSYLITLYNKQEFIGDVLDSVLAEQVQTGGEIVVYDDCSTDRSPEIVKERAAAHPDRVRVIRGETNRGVSFAANYLIELATQPYTRFADADDMLVKGSTPQLMRLLQENKLGFIYGKYRSRLEDVGEQTYKECFLVQDPLAVVLRHLSAIPSSSFMVTEELKKVCPLPEWARRTQDFTIFFRLAWHGTRMGSVKEVTALLPPVYTEANLSSGSAAAYAELCRTVALDAKDIPLHYLRSATRRYAGRAAKYFHKEGQSKLTAGEKFDLWRWRQLAGMASLQTCIDWLGKTADLFDRDRLVIKGLRKS